jgi:hypothetical protein
MASQASNVVSKFCDISKYTQHNLRENSQELTQDDANVDDM